MMPSLVARPAFFSADARPFLRRYSVAAATSPSFSTRAFLQSIIPAPVVSRSDLTVFASMAAAMTANPLLGATTAAGEWRNGCGDSKRPWAPRRNARAMIAAEPASRKSDLRRKKILQVVSGKWPQCCSKKVHRHTLALRRSTHIESSRSGKKVWQWQTAIHSTRAPSLQQLCCGSCMNAAPCGFGPIADSAPHHALFVALDLAVGRQLRC
mmetsp:Transcript_13876/g.45385  ORF Transcript_13876/g.45385 Transcript_13876/m.45385 type:complete len:211 (-) Transcript_13876:1937-2569(-)